MNRYIKISLGLSAAIILIGYANWGNKEQAVTSDKAKKISIRSAIGASGGIKDDPQSRIAWERMRLADPSTGEIPEGIVQSSMAFAKDEMSQAGGLPKIKFSTPLATTDLTWSQRGPFNVGGRTRALAIDNSNENTYLAGGVSGGMWRSTDAGSTWTKTTGSSDLHSVTAIAQDPVDPLIWYYSTGELAGNSASGGGNSAFFLGNGIYKSIDGGVSWTLLPATTNTTPQTFDNIFEVSFSLVVDANRHVYAAVSGSIQRSTNFGDNWSQVLNGTGADFSDIIVTNNNIFYATFGNNGTNEGIFRSTDGTTWSNITPSGFTLVPDRIVLDYSRQNDVIYVLASVQTGTTTEQHVLFKYTHDDMAVVDDRWVDLSANIPAEVAPVAGFISQFSYDLYVKVNPANENLVFLGGTNIFRSTDGFSTSNNISWIGGYATTNDISIYENHHPDQHALVFFPSNSNRALSGHDGGVSITSDITTTEVDGTPVNWNSLNNGYLTTQAYTVAVDPSGTSDSRLLAGFQDNGTWFTNSSSLTTPFSENLTGDGGFSAFANNGLIRYVSAQKENLFRLVYANADAAGDQFTSFTRIDPTLPMGAGFDFLFINPFILDKNDDNIIYVAGNSIIWRNLSASTADQSTGWTQLSGFTSAGSVSALDVSTTPANVLYFGTSNGQVFKMDNANATPTVTEITNLSMGDDDLPSGAYVSSVFVDPNDANNVFVTFSNYSVNSIFNSTDGGANWTDISGTLEQNANGSGNGPSVGWFSMITNGTDTKYFAATSTGLYSTTSLASPNPTTSPTWTLEDPGGIGNVVVDMVVTRPSDGTIAVATHANGLYSSQFPLDPGTLNPPINLVATPISSSAIQLTWTDNTNVETGYVVQRSTSMSSGFQNIEENSGVVAQDGTGVTDSGLPVSGQTYFYRVAATNAMGMSDYSVIVSATTFGSQPPSNVTQVSVTATTATISWTDNTLSETEFEIERSDDNMNFSFVGDVDANVTTYTDNGLQPLTTYYYQVKARVDNVLTDPSSPSLQITTTSPTVPTSPPGSLSATVLSSTEIRINWNDLSTNETGFSIERSDFVSDLFSEIGTVGAGVTTFTSSGLFPGSTYFFRVKAFNEDGSTAPSNTVMAATEVASPDAPTDLTATDVTSTEVSLTWNDNSLTETAYQVQISTGSTTFSNVGNLDANTEAATITGLTGGITYSIRVVAINTTGETPSGVISVTTPQDAPAAPTDLTFTLDASGTILTLSWVDNSNDEVGFSVERSLDDTSSFAEIGDVEADITTFEDTIDPESRVFYRVRAFNMGGDSEYSNITSNILTAVNDLTFDQEVTVYPNPSPGTITIDMGRLDQQAVQVTIFDYSGRKYNTFDLSGSRTINLSHLENGLYLFELSSGQQKAIQKVLLQQ